jgi:hypothetical protein
MSPSKEDSLEILFAISKRVESCSALRERVTT